MPHSGYTICTSEQRLSSTTVSHGFDIEWYSSPPFGSHGPRKHSEPGSLNFGAGDPCSRLDTLRSHQRGGTMGRDSVTPAPGLSHPALGGASREGRFPAPASACDLSTHHTTPSPAGPRRHILHNLGCVAFTMHFGLADSPFQPASSIDSLVRVSRRAVGSSDSPSCSIASLCHVPSGEPARPARATIRMVQPTGRSPAPQPSLCT